MGQVVGEETPPPTKGSEKGMLTFHMCPVGGGGGAGNVYQGRHQIQVHGRQGDRAGSGLICSGPPKSQKNSPARVIWGSTRAPTEMELGLQLTAVGLQPTTVGCN